jgi:hypothetical protein
MDTLTIELDRPIATGATADIHNWIIEAGQLSSERSREAVARFIDAYERRYFEWSPAGHDEVTMWKPIVAAVRYSAPHPPSSDAPLLRIIECV